MEFRKAKPAKVTATWPARIRARFSMMGVPELYPPVMEFETKVIHAGAEVDEATGAVAPPLYLSTTFERDTEGATPRGYSYVRDANPTQHRLEEALAAIDSGEAALAFASGMSAASALLQSLAPGAHVLFPDDSYYAIRSIAGDFFPRWGASADFIAMEDLNSVRRA